jgi:hypothetical protein
MEYTEEQIWEMEYDDRRELASDVNTSPEVLRILSEEEDENIRDLVAGHPNTPEDVLMDLATDYEWGVRWEIAFNSNSTTRVLVKLLDYERSNDKDFDILDGIMSHANCKDFKAIIRTIIGNK